ncbi:nuclear transport factor 2 family protein [Rhizorhabdus wittichii]|uniref:Nuclear transport factor 2 family protein n=1 Tax=Rhizorhabdus wittichii TaxID=160791 RepID=A0A975D7T2_9SPHN|nr:nuclear transport factor 2 family protein [Rhizorhabdus wittichii]QTH24324.1 nuclear transport factor 2 family protein [Rhizorhabdus wittichii]
MNAVDAEVRRLLDEQAIRRAATLYAIGADRRDPAIWTAIMAEEMVLVTPRGRIEGRARVLAALPRLAAAFAATQHRVLNQHHIIDGDDATGETYCVADHMTEAADGARSILSWAIRYQDRLRRIDGRWLFTRRELVLDWEERRAAVPRATG